ncbi:MAG: extracellular solute-binding protein [Candidatus Thiodiazotropha sp.]|jgi:putative spermidine/putrescine transport system substrate-binding protein
MFFLIAIRRLVLFSSSVFVLAASPPVLAQEVLRVLAWDGYADPEIVAIFENRTGVSVEVTYTDSDDDLWEKLNDDGGNYDVFAVNTAELQRYIDLGLSIPISMDNISNHAQQLPRFQDYSKITGIVHDGKTYAVPYTYSEMGLIYNRNLVKTPPHSIAAMWAPEYRGRVLAFNTSNHNFTLAGLLMGVDNPFKMSPTELNEATKILIKLRRNVLTFYTMADEATQWFKQYDIALVFANYGTQQVKALRDAGADIGYVIPREGALAWLDCWAISNAAKNRVIAESWINYMLEKPVSEHLTSAHGLANTITPFPDSKTSDKILWLEPLENPAQRKALWDKILSGQPFEAF